LRAGFRFIRLIALDARVAPGNLSRSSRGIGKGLDQIPVRPSQKSGFSNGLTRRSALVLNVADVASFESTTKTLSQN
jgi:hypothetical protein